MSNGSANPSERRPRGRPRKDAGSSSDTRDRLLEAAEAGFVELGYEGVTINEIATRAGYTTGAIYNHFDGKAELLIEVVRRVLGRVRSVVLRASVGDTPRAQGEALVEAWFALPRADRQTLAEVHMAASRHERVAVLLGQALAEARDMTEASIVLAQANGDANPDLDARRLALIFVVLLAGLNHVDTIDPTIREDTLTKSYLAEWIGSLYSLPIAAGTPKRRRARR